MQYKIFCDESNHLLNDKSNIMVNGAMLIESDLIQKYNKYIKYLRHKYNYFYEIKWTKLFSKNFEFYKELIDFFIESNMRFKATLVTNKKFNRHKDYGYSHNHDFYYIAYFYTLRDFIEEYKSYRIYIDYKDSKGGEKIKTLKETLKKQGLKTSEVEIYIINSKESQIMQLCDLFVGAIGYYNRSDIEKSSEIKNRIINYMINKKINLSSTYRNESKFNIFRWDLKNADFK